MTTEAQIHANRLNAQKSTGPRTPEGKAIVAQNAVKHGFWSQAVVISGEDPEEFALFREGLLAELAPVGLLESILAERIVSLSWRLGRAERMQVTAFEKVEQKEPPKLTLSQDDYSWLLRQMAERGMHPWDDQEPEPPKFGRAAAKDFNQERVLDRLLMYERRLEHSLYRTMAELRKLRKEGGFSSVKCEVSSWKSEREAAGLATAHLTPETVAQPQSGETKPISAEVAGNQLPDGTKEEEVGRGRPTHEEQSCGTKPISAPAIKGGGGYRPNYRRHR